MIKILNESLEVQAVLNNLISSTISEKLDQTEKTFKFSTVIDEEKSQYVQYGYIVEVEDDYFSIIATTENHNDDDTLTIDADCEHISYSLSDEDNVLDYFTAYGTPEEILEQLLQDTPFTVGTVEFTEPLTVAINENVTRRGAILTLANQLGAELLFKKYQVSLLTRRGADRGVQIRYSKNIIGLSRKVDGTKKIDGLPTISYEVSVPMLESLPEYGELEHVELGDDIRVIDEKLNVNVLQRVVSIAYDPIERVNLDVQITNSIDDITNTLTGLMQKTVAKDSIYNGCRIGPEEGFVAERSDKKVKTVMNATEGFKIQQGDGSGGNWVDVVFMDTNGNAVFKGKVDAGQFVGGTITGAIITGAIITGATITGGTINVNTDAIVGEALRLYKANNPYVVFKNMSVTNGQKSLMIGQETTAGAGITNLDRVDIFAGWLYVYNNLYVASNLSIGGLPAATQDYVNSIVSNAIANHIAEYHS